MSVQKRYRYAMAALFIIAAIVVFVRAETSGTYFSVAYAMVLILVGLVAAGFGYNVWYHYERRVGINIVLGFTAVVLVTPVFR